LKFIKGSLCAVVKHILSNLKGNANNSPLALERFPKVQYRIDRSVPVSDTVSPAKISRD